MQAYTMRQALQDGGELSGSVQVPLRVVARLNGVNVQVRLYLGHGRGVLPPSEHFVPDLEAFCADLGFSMSDVEWQSTAREIAPTWTEVGADDCGLHTFSAFAYLY